VRILVLITPCTVIQMVLSLRRDSHAYILTAFDAVISQHDLSGWALIVEMSEGHHLVVEAPYCGLLRLR
jgi:hypothetical protein